MTATDFWQRAQAALWWLLLSVGVLLSIFLAASLVGAVLWGLWQIVVAL